MADETKTTTTTTPETVIKKTAKTAEPVKAEVVKVESPYQPFDFHKYRANVMSRRNKTAASKFGNTPKVERPKSKFLLDAESGRPSFGKR